MRVETEGTLWTNVVYALRDAALDGMGIALLREWLVAADVESGWLQALLPGWKANQVEVLALHRRELRGAARIRAFLDHARRGLACCLTPASS